ncbi:thermonuclease family protein [Paracoccus nototheniae]|uniref:Thermonuclease family protein n=1 Tax=Paracoccus nototheniae TaxID=2489002 RepID=A0ABW4E4Z6_9RHOB|nr:thermonuclease family protein [Paracoccus nototheniae]
MSRIFAIAALCCALAGPGFANGITGQASVIDGDTLEIHGERIRLVSIDAPESRQPCFDRQGRPWRCGQQAALALSDFIARRPVTCLSEGRDRYRRILGDCAVAGISLSAWMIENGWAVPYYDRDRRHTAAAGRAEAAQRGIWSGTFEVPSDWRRGN